MHIDQVNYSRVQKCVTLGWASTIGIFFPDVVKVAMNPVLLSTHLSTHQSDSSDL